MKKLILILILLSTLPLFGQVRLSTMDSITTFGIYDYSYWNALSGGAYLNRKVSYTTLALSLAATIDDYTLTWVNAQTFTATPIFNRGATFSAGTHGAVTFNDSTYFPANPTIIRFQKPLSKATINAIGTLSEPYDIIYADVFRIPNTEGNDSVSVTYDDSTLTFDKDISIPNLSVTETFSMDSAAAIQSLKLTNNAYTIVDVGDSVITTATLMSNIQLALPGDVTKGIETITMTGAAVGHIILLYTTDADDSVLFVDAASDGNLYMAGNLWLRAGDNIAFMYIYDQPSLAWAWMELWRKDNSP